MKYEIAFPHLNIFIEHLQNSIIIGNFTIAFYGIIISLAMIIGFYVILLLAKKKRQLVDTYYDLFIIIIISAIVGARAYYVIFNWKYYSLYPAQIFNLRAGGLAVYGGIILGIISVFVYSKIKRFSFLVLVDTLIPSLALGQAIGRWGNFFNMEAFGDYTNNIFAMQLNRNLVAESNITMKMLYNVVHVGEESYIQVHPTFLYESFGCLIIFVILILAYFNKKNNNGLVLSIYMLLYGILRFFIEGIRTDSLMIANTDLRISQLVSASIAVVGLFMIIRILVKNKNDNCIS